MDNLSKNQETVLTLRKQGLTQKEIGDELGVSKQAISKTMKILRRKAVIPRKELHNSFNIPLRGIKFFHDGYVKFNSEGNEIFLHRHIWEINNGTIPEGYVIHHINLNRSDNRLNNLMCLTHKQHRELHKKIDNGIQEITKKFMKEIQ